MYYEVTATSGRIAVPMLAGARTLGQRLPRSYLRMSMSYEPLEVYQSSSMAQREGALSEPLHDEVTTSRYLLRAKGKAATTATHISQTVVDSTCTERFLEFIRRIALPLRGQHMPPYICPPSFHLNQMSFEASVAA